MTDLKTLKDILPQCRERNPSFSKGVASQNNAIKQEAINWIRYLHTEVLKQDNMHGHSSQCDLSAASILIQFFNITNEEIKEVADEM